MNKERYLNYAVYMTSHGNYLVKVEGGYAASEAFRKSDKVYDDIAGTKFGGIFGDDGKYGFCSKYNIRRLNSDEEFDELFRSSCREFKFALECLDVFQTAEVSEGFIKDRAIWKFLDDTNFLKKMLDEYPKMTPKEWVGTYLH